MCFTLENKLMASVHRQYLQPTDPSQGYTFHLSVLPSYWRTMNPLSDRNNPEARAAAERIAAISARLSGMDKSTLSAFPEPAPALQSSSSAAEQHVEPAPAEAQPASSDAAAAPIAGDLLATLPSLDSTEAASTQAPLPMPPPTHHQPGVALQSCIWRPYLTHLDALSATQRRDLVISLSHCERYFASLVRATSDRANVQIAGLSPPVEDAEIAAGHFGQTGADIEDRTEMLLRGVELESVLVRAEAGAKREFESMQEAQKGMLGGGEGRTTSQIINVGYAWSYLLSHVN